MNEATRERTDFHPFLRFLSGFCQSSPGRDYLLALTPFDRVEEVLNRRRRVEDLAGLATRGTFPSLGNLAIPGFLDFKQTSILLEPEQFLTLLPLLHLIGDIRKFIADEPPLADYLEFFALPPFQAPLIQVIERTFNSRGDIKDSATPELRRLREKVESTQSEADGRARGLVKTMSQAGMLSSEFTKVRGGRLVLALNRDYKGQWRGLIHGSSKSGRSLFFEPEELLTINNDLVRYRSLEEAEVRKILKELTDAVRAVRHPLRLSLQTLAEWDALLGLDRFRREWGALFPEFSSEREFVVRGMRHPLIGPHAVAVDCELTPRKFILLISGPNSGGKTVFLKTLALFVILNQCGVPIIGHSGSRLPWVDQVFIEVGDDQSIFTQLSRFSSHMKNVAEILARATPESLVLLDELAGATSFEEGNALAHTIVLHLHERRIPAIVTTHFNGIKVLETPDNGLRNGAFQFDWGELAPTYQLVYDSLGTSFGLAISRRCGIPREIIDRAGQMVDKEFYQFSALVARLQKQLHSLNEREEKLKLEREDFDRQRTKLEEERTLFREKKREGVDKAVDDEFLIIKKLRREVEEMIHQWRTANGRPEKDPLVTLKKLEESLATTAAAHSPEIPPSTPFTPTIGQAVLSLSLHQRGTIRQLKKEKAQIEIQGKSFWLPLGDLTPAPAEGKKTGGKPAFVAPSIPQVLNRLPLLGFRLDEALRAVDDYLDRALLSNWDEVALVHGKGTGALKEGIRQHLRSQYPGIPFRPGVPNEGGDGVTVVMVKKG